MRHFSRHEIRVTMKHRGMPILIVGEGGGGLKEAKRIIPKEVYLNLMYRECKNVQMNIRRKLCISAS